MENRRLRCHITRGMFSDERVIEVRRYNGQTESHFVSQDAVRGAINSDGEIDVVVYQKNGATGAVIPTEYSEVVAIDTKDLIPA